jgi:hypothetical protein
MYLALAWLVGAAAAIPLVGIVDPESAIDSFLSSCGSQCNFIQSMRV